jgi:transposase-like protein
MENSNIYAGYRYPAQIISHAVWLYHRFTLSFRDIEEFMQYENNRCELSHQPTRQQEKQMRKFKLPRQAQRFLRCHAAVHNLFRPGRHLLKAKHYRTLCDRSFAEWDSVSCVKNLG